MYLLLLIVAVVSFVYLKIIKPYSHWPNRGVKQRRQIYVLGDNSGVVLGRETFFDTIRNLYRAFPEERYVGIYQFLTPTLLVRDPDLIKQITVKDFDHFVDHRPIVPDDVEAVWTRNLVSLKGDRWRDMRATVSPCFTTSKMKTIFNLVSKCAEDFNRYFLEKNQDVVSVELKDVFTRYTNDVIATVAFGLECDSLRQQHNDFYLMGRDVTNFATFRRIMRFFLFQLSPYLCKAAGMSLFPPSTTNFFSGIIKETIRAREDSGLVRPDLLHLLLEAKKGRDIGFAPAEDSPIPSGQKFEKKPITDEDIAAQALVFFVAGFDTVSTCMCFVAYELMMNEHVQKRLRLEVDETSKQGELTYEALMRMSYMDMVVSETLRKWPPGIITDRVCVKPYTIRPTRPGEKPLDLSVGDVVWLPIAGIHWDPEYFPKPEVFDPDRFSDANKSDVKPYAYIPFGAGPRNCIGSRFALVEIKTILFHLMTKFEFVRVGKTQVPLKLKKTLTFAAEDGFWICLKVRADKCG